MGSGAEHDVDLAACRVGVARARHPQHAPVELAAVELGPDGVAGPAGAHLRVVHRERFRLRIADLHDEPRLDAVEALAVVEPRLHQLQEVLDVLRRVGGKELERDVAALLEREHHRRRGAGLVLRQGRHGDEDEGRGEDEAVHARRPPEIDESAVIIHARTVGTVTPT